MSSSLVWRPSSAVLLRHLPHPLRSLRASSSSSSSSSSSDLVKLDLLPRPASSGGGRVAILTLNDPKRLNALTEDMGDRLRERADELKATEELRAVVLAGAGRAFSAGGDLDFLLREHRNTREGNVRVMRDFYARFLSLRSVPAPTVAAVQGAAIGAGLCLALGACDMRVAGRDAKIGMTFVRLGLHPGMAATHFMPRIASSPALATELLLTGRVFGAEEAKGMGLVNRVAEDPLKEALALAEEISSAAPVAVRHCLETIRSGQDNPRTLEESLQREAEAQSLDYKTRDLVEGVTALKEKRKPVFTGE